MARISPGVSFSFTDEGPHVWFLATCPVILCLGRLHAAVGVVRHSTIGPTHLRLFKRENALTWPRLTMGRCKTGLGYLAVPLFGLANRKPYTILTTAGLPVILKKKAQRRLRLTVHDASD